MEKQERNAIAYALLKVVVKEEVRFSEISLSKLRRKAGNLAKETGIPVDKILEVVRHIVREVFEEQIKAV